MHGCDICIIEEMCAILYSVMVFIMRTLLRLLHFVGGFYISLGGRIVGLGMVFTFLWGGQIVDGAVTFLVDAELWGWGGGVWLTFFGGGGGGGGAESWGGLY